MENYPGRKHILFDVNPFLTLSGNPGQKEVEGTGVSRGAQAEAACPRTVRKGCRSCHGTLTSCQTRNRPWAPGLLLGGGMCPGLNVGPQLRRGAGARLGKGNMGEATGEYGEQAWRSWAASVS